MANYKQQEFPLSERLIYLNHAAVAPWPKRTSQAVTEFAHQNTTYGTKYYLKWLQKEKQLRQQFKKLLNAPSVDDIALVKNTSEAISFVAYGLNWQDGENIVSSRDEFPSNRIPWQSLRNQGVEFREADLSTSLTPEQALFDLVDRNTRLITVSSVQFATGLRLDLRQIGGFCKKHNILFCIDAIQSIGAVEFDVQEYQADFVMADGHKWMLGPEGLGVFYTTPKARNELELTQFGWHMIENISNYENKPWEIHPTAQRFECGSPNMLGIHALSASLSLLLEIGMPEIEQRVIANAEYLIEKIQQSSQLKLLTLAHCKLKSGIIVFIHQTYSNTDLFKHLQSSDVMCALRGGGIRFSPHFYNSFDELDQALTIAEYHY
jgi:selenocysteine lyase/cysteine desulfurase